MNVSKCVALQNSGKTIDSKRRVSSGMLGSCCLSAVGDVDLEVNFPLTIPADATSVKP